MTPDDDRTSPEGERAGGQEVDRVLIPVEVLETTTPPGATPDLVGGMEVVLLGYHYVPLQSVPSQAREENGDEARQRLDELADAYREAGAKVTERLAFVHDPERAIARAAEQNICGSVLLPRPTDAMETVVAPIPGETHIARLLDVLASVVQNGVDVTLLHVAEEENRVDAAELLVEGAEDKLVERGVDREQVAQQVTVAEERLDAIADAAESFDGLVLGEFERSLPEALFGEVHERVAARYSGPMLLVRRRVDAEGPEIPSDA